MKVLNISIFLLIWSFSGKSFASPPKKDVFVSALPLCFCLAVNGGIMTSEYHTVGVNYYSGGLPMAGGGTQYGLFSRLHPWESSFFITTRFGYMESSWGHPDFVHESGASAGIDIGNRWDSSTSEFNYAVTWIGGDFYLDKRKSGGLPHGLRLEIGYKF